MNMQLSNAMAIADKIPELGHGGKATKNYLVKYAQATRLGRAIIDIGPFLGSTTAYLAIGAGSKNQIHSYDLWIADEGYTRKAKTQLGIELKQGSNLYSLWCKNIKPWNTNIYPHKEDIGKAFWLPKLPIGLYVDDAGQAASHIERLSHEFARYFVPGETILIMMDYFFYETHHDERYLTQKIFFERDHRFKFVERCKSPSRAAIFRYNP